MQITVFAKTKKTREGNEFKVYLSSLTKKDGSDLPVTVKFREDCGTPRNCPCNIRVNKDDCNLAERKYTDKDGNPAIAYNLWVTNWTDGEPYIDHSMDDFVD